MVQLERSPERRAKKRSLRISKPDCVVVDVVLLLVCFLEGREC